MGRRRRYEFLTMPLYHLGNKNQKGAGQLFEKIKLKKMTAKQFIRHIDKYIKNTLKLDSKCEYRLGEARWSHKADIEVEISKPKMQLFIEVDGEQPHPDTNVTKYWYWMNKNKISKKVVLIHIFGTAFYDSNYRSRSELCNFIANKMHHEFRNFVYISVPKSKHHRSDGKWKLSDLLLPTKRAIRNIVKFT